MRISAIIPARMASTRLPGKPLAEIGGAPMIVHTLHAAMRHPDIDRVMVATDHPDIAAAVHAAGGTAAITGTHHLTGTDRCREALEQWADGANDAILNLQGDEPFPDGHHLSAICSALRKGTWDVVSAMRPAQGGEAASEHRVKVAADATGRALYFSRAPIPHGGPYHIHLGIYGFAPGILERCAALPPGKLEQMERLEQLRWIEAGMTLGLATVEEGHSPGAIDTPEDLDAVRHWYSARTG